MGVFRQKKHSFLNSIDANYGLREIGKKIKTEQLLESFTNFGCNFGSLKYNDLCLWPPLTSLTGAASLRTSVDFLFSVIQWLNKQLTFAQSRDPGLRLGPPPEFLATSTPLPVGSQHLRDLGMVTPRNQTGRSVDKESELRSIPLN